MRERVKVSRLIFVDTEENQSGNHGKATLVLPNSAFCVHGQDTMRLTLLAFEMRRNWHSLNATNNRFVLYNPDYIAQSTDQFELFIIDPGSYTDLPALAAAIQLSLRSKAAVTGNGSATATCEYNATSRQMTLTCQFGANYGNAFFTTFHIKEGAVPAGLGDAASFTDCHEILGIKPSATAVPVASMSRSVVGASTAFVAPYPAQLNSLEALYLRTNLLSGNMQSMGLDRRLPKGSGLTETQIWARIPLKTSNYREDQACISWEDSNDNFQLNLRRQSLDSIQLHVTDAKGRLLAEVAPGEAAAGLLSFKVVMRWDQMAPIAPAPQHAVQVSDIVRAKESKHPPVP